MKKVLFFLGLSIAQMAVIGLITVLAIFSAPLIYSPTMKLPTFFIENMLTEDMLLEGKLAFILALFAIQIISAIWTHRDVKKFINQGVNTWIPAGWVLVMLILWFPGLTLYLFLRKFQYKIELKNRSQSTHNN